MGRSLLIIVILVSTIYAGIVINVQKEMYKLPGVIVNNFLTKECENASDYALRAAVRLATEDVIMFAGNDSLTFFPPTPYVIDNCKIDKIFFRVLDAESYEATTFVSGELQGRHLDYSGQIAYKFPLHNIEGPLFLYNDYSQQTHNTYCILPDQSEYADAGDPMIGRVCSVTNSNPNIIHYSSKALDKYVQGGGGTHKCVYFGQAAVNGSSGQYAWIQTPDPSAPNYQDLLDRLKNYEVFTISVYALPAYKSGVNNKGTLIWFASNPYEAKNDVASHCYDRPSAAIWYDNYNSSAKTVTMHYGVTINDGTTHGTYHHLSKSGVKIVSNVNNSSSAWHMHTLVFDHGTMTAYYDNIVVDTYTFPGGFTSIMPNDYGFTLGMRDIRADSPTGLNPTNYKHPSSDYMFYNGLMDQMAVWDRAFSPEEIDMQFNNYTDSTEKLYIKD